MWRKSNDDKTLESIRRCTNYCPSCGHTIPMPVQINYTICSHCGTKVRNKSKAKFNYELKNAIRKIERKEGK